MKQYNLLKYFGITLFLIGFAGLCLYGFVSLNFLLIKLWINSGVFGKVLVGCFELFLLGLVIWILVEVKNSKSSSENIDYYPREKKDVRKR